MNSSSFPMEEVRRLATLKQFSVLDTPPEKALDDLTALAATICAAPIAFISLIDEDRQRLKSKFGFDLKEIPRAQSFCAHALDRPELLVVPDAALDPRFAENPLVTAEPRVRFYAGAPLVSPEGAILGRLCVTDTVPRALSTDQENALRILAREVMTHLELHRHLNELRLSEERFLLLAKATYDAIWDWNMITHGVWWNEGLEGLFGYRGDEVEPGIESWTRRIHPDDREMVREGLKNSVNQGQASFSEEYRFLRKDGSYAHVLGRGHIIRTPKGKPIRIIGCMTDLTDRIQAEQRIAEQAALIDQARDAILVRDLTGRITFWNNGAERVYGWKAAETSSARFEDLLKPDEERVRAAERELLEKGEWSGELEGVNKMGEKVILDCRWTLLRNKNNLPKSFLHIDTDVTERKKVEHQLLRAQRMEGIGTLAGGIAHDLNNALGPIIMSLDLLKKRFPDRESQDFIGIIKASAIRGADMVRQVLSFARGVEGKREEVHINDLIGDIEKISNDTFLKHIHVRARVPQDLWTVNGDPTQLHQVLLNLCVNARDAMPHGGTLTITADNALVDAHYSGPKLVSNSPCCVCIQVEDTGTGMPPEVIEKIFDPFFTTKELGKGTGLGLSTTMAIVKSHGGYLSVYSEVGRGTNFKVYLPANGAALSKEEDDIEIDMPCGNGELILLVDDESAVRQITQQALEAYGYKVVVACNGREAVSIYLHRSHEIAVVLTDMMMPVMDGPAAIQILTQINPDVQIIAASGLATDERMAKASELGVKHFLSKPYAADLLLQVLNELILESKLPSALPPAFAQMAAPQLG